jgi:hypothetical protein
MSRNDEANIQGPIVQFIRTVAPHVVCFHTPNGGLRTKAESAKLKWQGVLAGVLDLTLLWAPRQVAFIEVKTRVGRLSDDQKSFIALLESFGIPWAVARSIDEAREALLRFGIETREALREAA